MAEITRPLAFALSLATTLLIIGLFMWPWEKASGDPCGESTYCYLDRMYPQQNTWYTKGR